MLDWIKRNKISLWFKFNVISRFISRPKSFTWSTTDMQAIRRWSSHQPHPFSKTSTLWDFIQDSDSAWTLKKAENLIKDK